MVQSIQLHPADGAAAIGGATKTPAYRRYREGGKQVCIFFLLPIFDSWPAISRWMFCQCLPISAMPRMPTTTVWLVAPCISTAITGADGGGDQRGERRVARHVGDEQPGSGDGQAEDGVEGEQDAGGRGNALAALELQEDRVEVAEEDGQCDQGDDGVAQTHLLGDDDGDGAFERIADQGHQRRLLVAAAQHVGGARIARAVSARIGQAEDPGRDHGEGNRAEQVSGDNGEGGFAWVN